MAPYSSVRSAGRGAAEKAREHAARAEELRRELTRVEREQRNWEAGAEGERLVAEALAVLEADGWTVLHDVRWPGRQRANVDHVAIGPGGVVVVDSKNWTGVVSFRDDELRVGGRSMARELTGVAAATSAVTTHVPARHRRDVLGVLCLVQQHAPAREVGAVTVVSRDAVADLLRALPTALEPRQVTRVVDVLARELGDDAGPAAGGALTSADIVPPRRAPRGRVRQPARRPERRRGKQRSGIEVLVRAVLSVVAALVVVGLFQDFVESLGESLAPPAVTTQQPITGP
ncbi:nuclease-related domain-containing protein [Kineococcus auxinigenes]|uniref:nuclease-related domain-containing protein n=1 Tax=unclassified Kineococcus TaxID=2621656 RepID=UPI003D7E5A86